MADELFVTGKMYTNVEEVKAAIQQFNEQNFTRFIITSNNKKSIVIQCTHGRQRKSKSCGIRPNQKYNFLGCKANIKVYKSQKLGAKGMRVTGVDLSHNHPVGREFYETHYPSTLKQREKKPRLNVPKESSNLLKIPSQAIDVTTKSQSIYAKDWFFDDAETMKVVMEDDRVPKVESDPIKGTEIDQISSNSNDLETHTIDTSEDRINDIKIVHAEGIVVAKHELDRDKKYNLVMPELMEIANLISSSTTPQFYRYMEDLDSIKRRIRQEIMVGGCNSDISGCSSNGGLEHVRIISVHENTPLEP